MEKNKNQIPNKSLIKFREKISQCRIIHQQSLSAKAATAADVKTFIAIKKENQKSCKEK